MLVRSPTLTKRLSSSSVNGSSPASRMAAGIFGTVRRCFPSTAPAMAAMWAGVVPQQPPTRFTNPASANSLMTAAVSAAASSYSPKALGRPAFG